MRRIGTATAATALAVLLGFVLRAPARAACCFEQCGWISCGINECPPSGECPGPLGSVIFFDANATCGEGEFSRCPPTEVGQCTDGVNNDFWTGDEATDCDDPDCAADPACPSKPVPAAGALGLGVTAIALMVLGVASLRLSMRT